MYRLKRDEVREARTAAMTSRKKTAVVNCRAGAQAVSCRAGELKKEKKKRRAKQASPLRVNRIPWAGVEDPLPRAQDTTS